MKRQQHCRFVNAGVIIFLLGLFFLGGGGIFIPTVSAEEDLFKALQASQFPERVEAPEFTLPLIEGGEAKLSDYKGKVIFLNFWATW